MTINEYVELAMFTAAPLLKDGPDKASTTHMLNAVVGLAGEVGEVCDLVKKIDFHHHPFDEEKVEELTLELGDVAWYLAMCVHRLSEHAPGITLEGIMEKNIGKLRLRYPNKFDPERSINRVEGKQ